MKFKSLNDYGDRTQKPYKLISGKQIGVYFLFFVLILLYSTSVSGQQQSYPENANTNLVTQNDSVKTNTNNFFEQKYLTGDWWGGRSFLKNNGVNFDLRYTSSYQGLMSGTGPKAFDYGGKVNALVNLNTENMHLWKGGGFNVHIEYSHGALNPIVGGVLFSQNTAQFWPVGSEEMIVGSSLYYTQKFSDQFNLALGKFNPMDMFMADNFFGGWGIDRFMNLIFTAPPSGLVPPIFMGGIFNYNTKPVSLSLLVFDPDDRTNDYFPGDLFSNGVNFSLSGKHQNTIADRQTIYSITGYYSTAESTDYSFLQPTRTEEQQVTKRGSYNITFQFTHNLQESKDDPNAVWAFYLRTGIADGNPNYVKGSFITGIGGSPLFFNRPQDSFGVGYFYYNLSDVLEDALDLVIPISDESAIEIYYNYSVTPWLIIGGDIQYINPFKDDFKNALVGAIRTQIRI